MTNTFHFGPRQTDGFTFGSSGDRCVHLRGGDQSYDYFAISYTGNAQDFGDCAVASWGGRMGAVSNGISDRGVWGGGNSTGETYSTIIEYLTISTTGNSSDFGNLTQGRRYIAALDNNTSDRGVWGGGQKSGGGGTDVMDYITISSAGNATDFGDLTAARRSMQDGTSNATNDRGIFGTGNPYNILDYITISSAGNATDFGDLTVKSYFGSAFSNHQFDRGIFTKGHGPSNIIEYVAISRTGNAQDFGDLTVARRAAGGASNGRNDRGVISGGDTGSPSDVIDYVTIRTTGNATDFGDLVSTESFGNSTSNA